MSLIFPRKKYQKPVQKPGQKPGQKSSQKSGQKSDQKPGQKSEGRGGGTFSSVYVLFEEKDAPEFYRVKYRGASLGA